MKPPVLGPFASLLLAASGASHAASLSVEVGDGIRPGERVLVAAYAGASDWMRKVSHRASATAPTDVGEPGVYTVRLDGLAAGRYGLVAYVDRNGNGQLDRGLFGRPTEPYGFSGGGGMFGPPDFEDAAVDVGSADLSVRIDLH